MLPFLVFMSYTPQALVMISLFMEPESSRLSQRALYLYICATHNTLDPHRPSVQLRKNTHKIKNSSRQDVTDAACTEQTELMLNL